MCISSHVTPAWDKAERQTTTTSNGTMDMLGGTPITRPTGRHRLRHSAMIAATLKYAETASLTTRGGFSPCSHWNTKNKTTK